MPASRCAIFQAFVAARLKTFLNHFGFCWLADADAPGSGLAEVLTGVLQAVRSGL